MSDAMKDSYPIQNYRDTSDTKPTVTLCPEDGLALDAILDHATQSAVDPQRTARVQHLLNILDKSPLTPPSTDLVARTLAALEKQESTPVSEPQLTTRPLRNIHFGAYLTEWIATGVAACLLIAILIPGISAARQDAQRVACTANLANFGQAFATYAANNNNELPNLGKSPDGDWLPHDPLASTGHSNAANVLPLVRQGYLAKSKVMCPARQVTDTFFDPQKNDIPDNIRGYSMVNLFGESRKLDKQSSSPLLSDRNPLFVEDSFRDPMANSLNHGRRGTNVLSAAQNVEWVKHPNIGPRGSNIWTIDNGKTVVYKGKEYIKDPMVVFMAP